MSTVLVEMVSSGLTQAIKPVADSDETDPELLDKGASSSVREKAAVITTETELEGFRLVQEIISVDGTPDPKVGYKDTSVYFGIHVDKPNRWFVRLYFNGNQKYVVVRLTPGAALTLIPSQFSADEIASQPDATRINIANVGDVSTLGSIILAAYKGVLQPVGV
jgi:hypothetical protein